MKPFSKTDLDLLFGDWRKMVWVTWWFTPPITAALMIIHYRMNIVFWQANQTADLIAFAFGGAIGGLVLPAGLFSIAWNIKELAKEIGLAFQKFRNQPKQTHQQPNDQKAETIERAEP